MLTNRSLRLMLFPVEAITSAGISSPNSYQGAQAPIKLMCAFFVPVGFLYGDVHGETFGSAGFLGTRSANPVCVVTILISSEWCRLGLDNTKDNTMLKHPYPVDGVITPVEQALSVIRCLQITLEDTTIDFRSETAANVLWIAEEKLRTALKVNDAWSEDWEVRRLDDQPQGGEGE